MELNIIVAVGSDGAIGKKGDLIWHIPSDLKRLKALTMGHPVIMGRKTWDSLPRRPLPGRTNIVITRQKGFEAPGAVVVSSPEEALKAAGDGAFVMGGAQIYEALIPYCTKLYFTKIDSGCQDADAWFPLHAIPGEWRETERSEEQTTADGQTYRYITLERI